MVNDTPEQAGRDNAVAQLKEAAWLPRPRSGLCAGQRVLVVIWAVTGVRGFFWQVFPSPDGPSVW
jgi:hypothetical protein